MRGIIENKKVTVTVKQGASFTPGVVLAEVKKQLAGFRQLDVQEESLGYSHVCYHCGAPWTNKDSAFFNGGCCYADKGAAPLCWVAHCLSEKAGNLLVQHNDDMDTVTMSRTAALSLLRKLGW